MTRPATDRFGVRRTLAVEGHTFTIHSLPALRERGFPPPDRLPHTIRILLENALRHHDDHRVTAAHVEALANWRPGQAAAEIPFLPARVLLQDFTGVPVVVDLAAMRDFVRRQGGDPGRINPAIPVDLVIDHSVQVDAAGSPQALDINIGREYDRNRERYTLLRWAQTAFRNFRVVPPGTGICHQVNLEYLATVVTTAGEGESRHLFPDTCVGTDSHTTMVNCLGVLGWGVGGIEAEAVMLAQPYYMLLPEVVGFRLTGRLPEGATATDLVLTVTQILRQRGVVGKFVEFFGPGLNDLSVPDRGVIANMAPEYGATAGFFPVDAATLRYLRFTGRDEAQIACVEAYTRAQGLFRHPEADEPDYSERLELDLATVEPSLAGPKRPQDRVPLTTVPAGFQAALTAPVAQRGYELTAAAHSRREPVELLGHRFELGHGHVVIAAITSCTNTSNPDVMVAAGLVARRAHQLGLTVPPWVKTSLAPGSRVVMDYLQRAGLAPDLEALGFHLVGYGCTTCIGNSGPLPEPIETAITTGGLVVASVLSGNRNFEGRIHPMTRANYLASPPLVVAYALAGRIDIDFSTQPIGFGIDGQPAFLRDLWPSSTEIRAEVERALDPDMFRHRYATVTDGDPAWRDLPVPDGRIYEWDADSTYIQPPPFFQDMPPEPAPPPPLTGARVLALLGDSVTTDHISPAGAILSTSPAGRYLTALGVPTRDYNSYGTRRGNHEVMMRGTFANLRLKNLLLPGIEGGVTIHFPSGERLPIYEAAMRYRAAGTPLILLAGSEYGTGSSRDWAAKGTLLLGVRAVIAKGYERIHRANLVGMGVLPLQFLDGEGPTELGLDGREIFHFPDFDDQLGPGQLLRVVAETETGPPTLFSVRARIDSPVELDYLRHGGILPAVLRHMARSGAQPDGASNGSNP